jgi:hypothetical protein
MIQKSIYISLTMVLSAAIFLLSACKKDKIDRFSVVYEIEFDATWSETTHPGAHPDEAAFSPFIAVSHLFGYEVFTPGLPPSESMELLGLQGNTSALESDFQFLLNTSQAVDFEKGQRIASPGKSTIQLGTARGYQYITLLSKIEPSPDWFVAATTSLIDPADGNWYDVVTVHVNAFTLGKDSAQTFLPPYAPVDTSQGVEFLNYGPLALGTDSVYNMGKFVFRRIK